jgi:hypothetical protein
MRENENDGDVSVRWSRMPIGRRTRCQQFALVSPCRSDCSMSRKILVQPFS